MDEKNTPSSFLNFFTSAWCTFTPGCCIMIIIQQPGVKIHQQQQADVKTLNKEIYVFTPGGVYYEDHNTPAWCMIIMCKNISG